jgi:hypothetical protein
LCHEDDGVEGPLADFDRRSSRSKAGRPVLSGKGDDDGIRLADVVVNQPTATFGGVVQYDMGKVTRAAIQQRTGVLEPPPTVLMANVQRLQAQQIRSDSQILEHLAGCFWRVLFLRADL